MASSSTKKRKRKRSKYEEIARNEKLKWQQDDIYMMLMNPDTTKIDGELKEWREKELALYDNKLSGRFTRNTLRAIEDKKRYIRIAKHGLLFLRIWLDNEYAQSFIASPKPRVNPIKFKKFYEEHLDKCCRDLLNTNTTTLQAFVEKVRSIYFKL
tara:strand:+ start:1159 stop:1623 length:465 start_codon:yes stop_codon:yes gene_type:complete